MPDTQNHHYKNQNLWTYCRNSGSGNLQPRERSDAKDQQRIQDHISCKPDKVCKQGSAGISLRSRESGQRQIQIRKNWCFLIINSISYQNIVSLRFVHLLVWASMKVNLRFMFVIKNQSKSSNLNKISMSKRKKYPQTKRIIRRKLLKIRGSVIVFIYH